MAVRQSMVKPSTVAVVPRAAHALLQALNCAASVVPEQVLGAPLITQFRAAAVSWLANWWSGSPSPLTHSDSTAELCWFRWVSVSVLPQIDNEPPATSITCWVMFRLFVFSQVLSPAAVSGQLCVPQKLFVSQMRRATAGVGVSAGVFVAVPLAVLVAVAVAVCVRVLVAAGVFVPVGVSVLVSVAVGVLVGVGVAVAVDVDGLVAVTVADGVSVAVGAAVLLAVDVPVGVDVDEPVAVNGTPGLLVAVGVSSVPVGVLVGVNASGAARLSWATAAPTT
jgi:hypothetical protein